MPRRLSILLIAVAALLAVEPLLHQHPITGRSTDAAATSSATCVVCAAGVSRLADAAPAVVAPVRIVYASFATVTTSLRIGVALTLPSRAPPAA